jgi:hypothetical protein
MLAIVRKFPLNVDKKEWHRRLARAGAGKACGYQDGSSDTIRHDSP